MGTQLQQMSEDKNWRFFAANIAAAALLVNGIGFIANRSSNKQADAEPKEEEESKCPCRIPNHSFSHMCGVAAITSAVCLQDRLPYAGAAGAIAAAMPFMSGHEDAKKAACPLTAAVAFVACGYLFASKPGRFAN